MPANNTQGGFKRPIDVSVNREYSDFRSRFAVVSKLRANIWLTTAMVLFVIGFAIGVVYIVDPQGLFGFGKIASDASHAASVGDNLQAVLSYNTCLAKSEGVYDRWFATSGLKSSMDAQAATCGQSRLQILQAHPELLQERFVSMATNKVPPSAEPFIERISSQTITGVLTKPDASPTAGTTASQQFVFNQAGTTKNAIVIAPGSLNLTSDANYSIKQAVVLPGGTAGGTPVYIVASQGITQTGQQITSFATTSSGSGQLTVVPVFYAGQPQTSSVDLASVASSLAAYFNAQSGGKMHLTGTVGPAITSQDKPSASYCFPPAGGAGSGLVIYALNEPCTIDTGGAGGAAVNAGAALSTYIHELGHTMGLGHIAGGNPSGDPMDGGVVNPPGSFNIVHKDLLGWANIRTITSNGPVSFSGVDAIVIPGGCPQNSQFYKATNSLYIDGSKNMYCWYPWDHANGVDSEYKGTMSASGYIGGNVSITVDKNGALTATFTGTPPPSGTGASTGTCTTPGCGTPVTVGKLGPVSLICPSGSVTAQAGGQAHLDISASGDSRATIYISIPTRLGPLGPRDHGTRGSPTPGFRPGDIGGGTLYPGSFTPITVSVDPSVAPGTYSVSVEGQITTYEGTDSTGEPIMISVFTTCSVSITVTAAAQQGPGSAFLYINGHRDDGGDLRVSPGDSVSVTWTSGSMTSCDVSVAGRSLGDHRTEVDDTSLHVITITQDTSFGLVCTRSDGSTMSKGMNVLVGAPDTSGHGLGGLIANIEVGSMQHIVVTCPPNVIQLGCGSGDTVVYGKTVQVAAGSTGYVRWTSTNATNCSVSPLGVSGTSGSGTIPNISAPTIVTINCRNSVGSASDTAQITLTGFVSGSGGGNTLTCTPGNGMTPVTGGSMVFNVNASGHATGTLTLSIVQGDTSEGTNIAFSHIQPKPASIASVPGSTRFEIDTPAFGGRIGSGTFLITATDSSGNVWGQCPVLLTPGGQVTRVDFTGSPNPVTVKVGEDASVQISGGVLPLTFNSAIGLDTSIATAGLSGTTLTVHGVAPGTTSADVMDSNFAPGASPVIVTINVVGTTSGGGTGGSGCGTDSGFTFCLSYPATITGDFPFSASVDHAPSDGVLKLRVDDAIVGNCSSGATSCDGGTVSAAAWAAGSTHSLSVVLRNGTGVLGSYGVSVTKGGSTSAQTGTTSGTYIQPSQVQVPQTCSWYDVGCQISRLF